MTGLEIYLIGVMITVGYLVYKFKHGNFFNILMAGYFWPLTIALFIAYKMIHGKQPTKIFEKKQRA